MEYEKLLEHAFSVMPRKKISDQRFVMPAPQILLHGQKTIIKNFYEMCETFRREPSHFMKFILKELATSGELHKKELVLQGKFSKQLIEKKVREYADIFVFCRECKSPDTKLEKKDKILVLRCEACGATRTVRSV